MVCTLSYIRPLVWGIFGMSYATMLYTFTASLLIAIVLYYFNMF